MLRTKVKLQYITDRSKRKTSFLKRKASVKKKLSKLCTLCGDDACAIVYSQYDTGVEVWPSNLVAQYVLDQFMLVPEVEQSKKMVNQDSYIRKRISKAKEQLDKQLKENREKKIDLMISECLNGEASLANLNLVDLKDMVLLIDRYISKFDEWLEFLKGGAPPSPPPQPQPHQPQADVYVPVAENPGSLDGIIPSTEWFTDWDDGHGLWSRG